MPQRWRNITSFSKSWSFDGSLYFASLPLHHLISAHCAKRLGHYVCAVLRWCYNRSRYCTTTLPELLACKTQNISRLMSLHREILCKDKQSPITAVRHQYWPRFRIEVSRRSTRSWKHCIDSCSGNLLSRKPTCPCDCITSLSVRNIGPHANNP